LARDAGPARAHGCAVSLPYELIRFLKFAGVLGFAGGAIASLVARDLEARRIAVHRVASASLLVTWIGGFLLADVLARPLSELWIVAGFGLSFLAIASALLQLVQSRMMLPAADPDNDDPNARIQRQTMLFLPLISVVYGGFLPAGLFIYWIVATVFSIVQQYLIVGWGAMFPFFGWTPAFAVDHTPRFPVAMPPPPDPSKRSAILAEADKRTTADKTIRHRERGRQGRRGRRR